MFETCPKRIALIDLVLHLQRRIADFQNLKPQVYSRHRTEGRPEKANRLDSRSPTPRADLPFYHVELDRRKASTRPRKRNRSHARAHPQRLLHAFRITGSASDAHTIPSPARVTRETSRHAAQPARLHLRAPASLRFPGQEEDGEKRRGRRREGGEGCGGD